MVHPIAWADSELDERSMTTSGDTGLLRRPAWRLSPFRGPACRSLGFICVVRGRDIEIQRYERFRAIVANLVAVASLN